MQTRLTYLSFMVNKKMCVSFFVQYSKSGQNGTWGQNGTPGVLEKPCQAWVYFQVHLISVIGQFSVMHGNQTCNRPSF